MKGKHHIIIESSRLKYEFDIKRNITIIKGESATGKTTLIELLEDYRGKEDTAVQITSDVPCRVFSDNSETWLQALSVIENSIVFIDEDNHFVRTKEFAGAVKGSSNYFVLITRESLPELPYSVNEIYGIRTSGKYHFPEQIYHEFYPIYENTEHTLLEKSDDRCLITEDSNAGFQFFCSVAGDNTVCVSSGGNSNIYQTMKCQKIDKQLAVVADGAAFGAFVEKVLDFRDVRGNTMVYLPESFEWVILKSGVATDATVVRKLESPESEIESAEYMSWEQYFTDLLTSETKDDNVRRYNKNSLGEYYLHGNAQKKMLQTLPDELQRFMSGE